MAHESKSAKHWVLPTLIGVIFGGGAGFAIGYAVKPTLTTTTQSLRENTTAYKFIHPLLAVNRSDESVPSPQYADLSGKVGEYISETKSTGSINTASVYFINYGKTGSFAINQNEKYDPASMLKVVIMVAFLKRSETDPELLDNRLVYTASIQKLVGSLAFETPSKLQIGQEYTVEELIEKMIIDSDNGAMNLLLSNIQDAYLTQVYKDLGLSSPELNAPYTISAKDYSLFFRILYNATYLSSADSEKALGILSHATFADGLVAGMPTGTTVAHKFGEHVNGTGDHIDSIELHDCGITYTAGGPYLLCVMTKGKTLDLLKAEISGISKMVYDEVSKK